MKNRHDILLISAGLSLFAAPIALAQDDSGFQLEEIVVTAERRAANIQNVALSVTAISAETIAAMGARNVHDLQNFVPGLSIRGNQIGAINFVIRGIGEANDDVSTDSGVGVYVDDIYMARTSASNLALYDLERVEVLRGPQGTLYGRNTAGGSINIITLKPSDTLSGKIGIDVGSEGLINANAFLSGPIVANKLFAKISIASMNRDGLMVNSFDGVEGNKVDTLTGRFGLRFLPTERSELLFTIDSEKTTPGPNLRSLGPNDGFENFATIFGPLDASDPVRTANVNNSISEEFETTGGMLRLNVDYDAATLSLIGGLRTERTFYSADFDQSPEDHLNERHDQDGEWGSLEVRLSSNPEGALSAGGKLDWTAGLYYFSEDTTKTIDFDSTTLGFVLCNFAFPPFVCAGTPPGTPTVIGYSQAIDTSASAVFGQLNYSFTDRVSLTAGLRYTDEDKDFRALSNVIGPIPAGPFNPLIDEDIDCTGTKNFTNVSGKLALEFAFHDSAMVYGSLSQGYRSGGYNGQAFNNAEACGGFDEETADNFEIGLKADWAGQRIRTNISIFSTDYEDLQVSVIAMPNGPPTTTNAADAEITGAELEFQALLTDRFSINGNVAVLDATFNNFMTFQQGVPVDLSGTRIASVPDLTWNLGFKYGQPLGNGAYLEFRGDYVWEDETEATEIVLPQWSTTNFTLSYEPPAQNWRLSAWVRNAFDELYWTSIGIADSAAINAVPRILAEPRTYGITFNYFIGDRS